MSRFHLPGDNKKRDDMSKAVDRRQYSQASALHRDEDKGRSPEVLSYPHEGESVLSMHKAVSTPGILSYRVLRPGSKSSITRPRNTDLRLRPRHTTLSIYSVHVQSTKNRL